jgi:hypothetical protein
VTVTVWGTFQFCGVKVRLAGLTVPPACGLLEEKPMVTSAVGAASSTTLNWAVPPDSVVTSPEVGLTWMPARRPVSVKSWGW